MSEDVELWAWLLFNSGLPTLRAKELLQLWQAAGVQPQEAIAAMPAGGPNLGLSASEARQLAEAFRRRAAPPGSSHLAMTWDAATYPAGLTALPLRLRPALLYYRGSPELLTRMVIYLPPGELAIDDHESVREVVSLLLGEHVLLGVYEGSGQATLVLDEMAAAEGEALIFARSGLASERATAPADDTPLSARTLIVSPLPPAAPQQPAWEAILQQVALAAADRIVLTGQVDAITATALAEQAKPTLALPSAVRDASMGTEWPLHVQTAKSPADVLDWITDTTLSLEAGTDRSEHSLVGSRPNQDDTFGLRAEDVAPPLSPEQILETLEKGGPIPEALRRRLLDAT